MGKHFKTLFISGYESEMVKNMGVNVNSKQFLSKPFQPMDLLAIVRRTLDGIVD